MSLKSSLRRAQSSLKGCVLMPVVFAYYAVAARLARVVRRLLGAGRRPNSALVMEVTATSIGNLGDQAMVGGALQLLRDEGVTDVGIITWRRAYPWQEYAPQAHHAFTLNGLWNALLVPWRMSRYERFYYLAADMLDGGYSVNHVRRVLDLATIAHLAGLRSTLCGFSFNRPSQSAVIQRMRRLPAPVRLCCRDPLTHQRITELLGREAELVADIAFNLCPDDASPAVQEMGQWIDAQRTGGRQILAVNLHRQLIGPAQDGMSAAQLNEAVAGALDQVATQRDVALVLLPHVYRGAVDDLAVLEQLREAMPPALREKSLLPPRRLWANEVKALCSRMDLVLTGRMHLAIATLGQGVPVICLTYQGDKFEGLMKHFGLTGNTFPPSAAADQEQFAECVVSHLDRSTSLKQQVRDALPNVLALSKRNA